MATNQVEYRGRLYDASQISIIQGVEALLLVLEVWEGQRWVVFDGGLTIGRILKTPSGYHCTNFYTGEGEVVKSMARAKWFMRQMVEQCGDYPEWAED